MLKSFEELRKIDVRPYCDERDGMLYLNWAKCITLLRENGAEDVRFEQMQNPANGSSLFYTDLVFADKNGNVNRCYETKIKVVIDGNEYTMQHPVLNGKNPVKDNSMNQLRVWNSVCRSFVKCVAINTGLGFDLWTKEEAGRFSTYIPGTESGRASEAQKELLKRLGKEHRLNVDKWIINNGGSWDTLTGEQAGCMLNTIKEKYGDE